MRPAPADFTSGLFLGLGHRGETPPGALVTGRPAALEEPAAHGALAAAVADAVGQPAGLLARTSLHALIDVLAAALPRGGLALVARHAYPIAHWAAAVAAQVTGARVILVAHHDPDDLERGLRHHQGRPAVALVDGWCGGCLRPAPLPALLEVATAAGAVGGGDDTQGVGVLGHRPGRAAPFGVDGAGTAAWFGLAPGRWIVVASAAKALGAPLAVVAGPSPVVARARQDGPARMHASPPTSCDVTALGAAWRTPSLTARRRRLAMLTAVARQSAQAMGFHVLGRPFPILALRMPAAAAHAARIRLGDSGIKLLAVRTRCRGGAALTACLRADHTDADVSALLAGLAASGPGVAA